ncbi:ubx domain-containing protein 4 [Limosa lapponica baueri]|uniref:Ubx domain-containing protein 4 n=1 Tax=Limosa lapponica baueri TaxID=1758121 RepID=A0A2I0UNQ4_LIMLA|nr:ubx domain-containing protein 4 [Limosa lapponica baueri]
MVRQAVTLQPTEVNGGTDLHLKPRENPTPECLPAVTSRETHTGAGSWQDLWTKDPVLEHVCWQDLWLRGGRMLEQSVPEGLHPLEGIHAGVVCEELQPVGRTHVGEVCGELSPVGGTPCWSRGRV